MAALLVSVRNAAEALVALENGADVIDVKEPSRGSLGKADDAVIREVLDVIDGRRPVSAAMGELSEWPGERVPAFVERLAYVKWGLMDEWAGWKEQWRRLRAGVEGATPCRLVLAGYADVGVDGLARMACEERVSVLLIDTCSKGEWSLASWLSEAQCARIVSRCREAGVKPALAGGLRLANIRALAPLRPEWFAVRGAACVGGREGTIDAAKVRELAEAVCAAPG